MFNRYSHTELHISTSSGFTPSSSTLKATGRTGHFNITDLTPGTTYYYRLRHLDWRGNPGEFSPEQSFIAGYTQLPHIDPALLQNAMQQITNDDPFDPTVSDYSFLSDTTIIYDDQGIMSPGRGYIEVASDGILNFNVAFEVRGVTPGDSAQIVVLKNTGSFVDDFAGQLVGVVTRAGVGGYDAIHATFNRSFRVSAGEIYNVSLRGYSCVGSAVWVVKAPTTTSMGSFWQIQQQLSS